MEGFFWAVVHEKFMLWALCGGWLAAVAAGVVGSYVVVRRLGYLAGAIAHSVLGGMGLVRYLEVVWGWGVHPLWGAVVAGVVAAAVVGWVSLEGGEREETVIGAIWACGMALGLVFIALTPGYDTELMGYLFGNILMVGPRELWMMAGLDAVVLGVCLGFGPRLVMVCFDEEFARLRGVNASGYYMLLLGVVGLTVVVLSVVVGVVMVIALLTLPAATAALGMRRLGWIMAGAGLVAGASTTLGLALSYHLELPAGASIILVAGAGYLLGLVGRGILKA